MQSTNFLRSAFGLAVLWAGCATGTAEIGGPAPRQGASVLTTADLEPFQDARQAITVLRRHWLAGRSSDPSSRPSVIVDGVITSGFDVLSGLSAYQVMEIRFLPGYQASARFAGNHLNGAILVTTRR